VGLRSGPGSADTVSLRRGLAISFVDQSLLSLGNFLVGIYLIANTGKEQYGMYAVACAAVLFIVGMQNALVTTQMTVLAPRDGRGERERFCAALATGQFVILLPALAAGSAVTAWAGSAGFLGHDVAVLSMAVFAALPGIVLREFFRGYYFRLEKPRAVLAADCLYLALLGAALATAAILHRGGLHVGAILAAGAASLCAGLEMLGRSGMKPFFRGREIFAALSLSWREGKWATAGVAVTWLQDQSYLYLLAALAGSVDAAEASAARLFLAPAALLNAGFGRVLLPRWAAMRAAGRMQGIRPMARRVLAWMIGLIAAYAVAIQGALPYADSFPRLREYGDLPALVTLWSMLFVAQASRSCSSWRLQAEGRFAPITRANGVSAVVTLVSGSALIGPLGAHGGIGALLIGEILLALLLRRACRHDD